MKFVGYKGLIMHGHFQHFFELEANDKTFYCKLIY